MFTTVEQKLLRLGLNEAAEPGEIQNCAIAFFRSLRGRGVDPEALISGAQRRNAPSRPDITLAMARKRTMPFGKHIGRRLEVIEPSYLRWALRECDNLSLGLREAILLVLTAGGRS